MIPTSRRHNRDNHNHRIHSRERHHVCNKEALKTSTKDQERAREREGADPTTNNPKATASPSSTCSCREGEIPSREVAEKCRKSRSESDGERITAKGGAAAKGGVCAKGGASRTTTVH